MYEKPILCQFDFDLICMYSRLLSVGPGGFWRADMCPTRIPDSDGRIAAALQIVPEGMGADRTGASAPADKLSHDLSPGATPHRLFSIVSKCRF